MAPIIVAHRGAMTEAPENTKPAFDKALAYAVAGIEFDVQITGDGRPVIFHDQSLEKINGSLKSISDHTFHEIAAYDWGGWYSEEFKNEKILTLDQVLKYYGHRTRLLIEIKPPPKAAYKNLYASLSTMVVESVRNLIPNDRIPNMYILSFDPELIKSAYINDPDLRYVLNLNEPVIKQNHLNIDPEILFGYCIEHTLLSRQFVDELHRDDKIIMTYSCNSEPTLQSALDWGVDVIMTDHPGSSMWKQFDLLAAD